MLEAVDQMTLDREPAPHLYKMLVGVLRTIGTRAGPLVVPAFFWKLLAVDGVRPELDACVRCGEPGPLVAFDLDEGGVLCRQCRSGTAISPEALDLMRQVLGGRLNDALALDPSAATHEVSTLATKALEHHIERRLQNRGDVRTVGGDQEQAPRPGRVAKAASSVRA